MCNAETSGPGSSLSPMMGVDLAVENLWYNIKKNVIQFNVIHYDKI